MLFQCTVSRPWRPGGERIFLLRHSSWSTQLLLQKFSREKFTPLNYVLEDTQTKLSFLHCNTENVSVAYDETPPLLEDEIKNVEKHKYTKQKENGRRAQWGAHVQLPSVSN